MRTLRYLLPVLALTVAGCFASRSDGVLTSDYPRQGVRTVAVLPVVNQTDELAAEAPMRDALARAIEKKRYAVVPQAEVFARLGRGSGLAAFRRLSDRLAMGEPVPDEVYRSLAGALEADALLSSRLLAFHRFDQQGTGMTSQGGFGPQTFRTSVVEVEASLFGARAGTTVWRDRHIEQEFQPPRMGRAQFVELLDRASARLLASLPENTWAPVTPSPGPTPRQTR